MADGQGFGSFDDLDKFLKQKPAVSPKQQQPAGMTPPPEQQGGGFKDFSTFDKFVSEKKKPSPKPQPLTKQPTMSAYKPSFARRLEDWVDDFAREHRPGTDIKGAFDPEIQGKQKEFAEVMSGPVSGVPTVLAGMFRLFTGEKRAGEKYPRIAAVSEIAGGGFTSLGPIGFMSPEAIPFVMGISAGGKLVNNVGEKLGVAPEISEAVVNILLLGQQARGMFKSKAMVEKGITAEKVEKAVQEELETEKASSDKPQAIQDIQTRIADGTPLLRFGMEGQLEDYLGKLNNPEAETDVLRIGERNLQRKLALENTKSDAQQRVGKFEREQQELAHKKKIALEQAKTEAEKRQLLAELDERGKELDREIAREKERFKTETTGLQRPVQGPSAVEMPVPAKKPFEAEPLEVSPGSRPMTREEREDQWLEERRKRYADELQEDRRRRLRDGEEIKVEDRRRVGAEPGELARPLSATPGAPEAITPPPGPETPPTPAAAPLAPPPQTREEIQNKIAAAAWQAQELELRKGKAKTPEEISQIESQQDQLREMAGDLAVDRIAEAMEGRKKPTAVKRGSNVEGPIGKSSELKTVTRNYPIRYRVIDGSSLKTSHDPMTFEPNSSYPEGVQERDYQRDRDAQLAVIQHTQGYDPAFTLSDNPGPENGPPMVTQDGVVLGGNSRAMSTMRLYGEGKGDLYKNALLERASQLGLRPEDIKDMKEPVLVREFLAAPTDVQSLRALGSDLNKVFTRKLSEFEQAVSAGKRLSPETLDYILHQLQELGEGSTMRDLLRERSKGILEKLEADGVIAPQERRGFIDEKTDTLNEAGKDFVENAILGSVVDDPLVLANAPRAALRKIERALAVIAKVKARGGAWDITDYLKEALREHIAAASKGESIQDHIDPPTALMFPREPIHPIVEGIALKLDAGSAEVKKAFEGYAADSDLDVKSQGTMAFFEPPTPWKSFSDNFGVDVKPQEWGTVKATVVQNSKATGAGTPAAAAAATPVAPLEPPPSIGDIFDEEVARMREEEGPPREDLGEIQLPKEEGTPSERFRAQAEKAFPKIDKEQMDTVMSIMGARARATGKTLDQWIDGHKLSVESEKVSPDAGTTIKKEGKGFKLNVKRVNAEVEFVNDGRTIIRAFQQGGDATVVSLAHELGHIFRRDLSPELLKTAEEWAGVKEGQWTVSAEEKFARGFEKYLHEGKAPTEGLRGVFENFRKWILEVYSATKNKLSPLKLKLNPEIREMFDRMLAAEEKPKPIEAPPVEKMEAPPERQKEILDPGPKKRYEVEEPPRRTLEASIRAMSDDDVRTAAKTIEAQTRRSGITPKAREIIEGELKPFIDELKRRDILDKPEKGFGESNTVFTKSRADSARERLRKKLGTTFYAGVDPELVRDVSEIMGYYFEGGIREFGALSRKVLSEFGDSIRPVLQQAYDKMLDRGNIEAKTPAQRDLFGPVRRIILPPGVEEEVRRAPETKAREERPPSVPPRKEVDASTRPEGRERARPDVRETPRPEGRTREPATGRGARSAGAPSGGGGVVEQFRQPLRAVQTPKLDVEHITDIPHTVEPTEWKARLKDANLPENLPPPTETISPQIDRLLAFKGQPEIVQTVLTSLRKYNGAILATSTGTGKTYMGSAILAELRPRMGLIVAPSQNIAKQWIDTAELFGVEIKPLEVGIPTDPGIYTTTYSTATNREGLDKINWNMVIADESHFARRWHDPINQRGKFLVELGKNSDKVLYASATPFHTPLELGYFNKLGLWRKTGLEPWLKNEFGVRQGEGGKWVVPMNYRKLAALRDELINRGMFVNLDRNMEGYSANFAVVPMSNETVDGVRNATQAFRMAEQFFLSKKQNKMVMAVRGNAATFMKSFLERQRLPQAIELGKKLENEGWKVIYFTESKKEVDDIYNFLQPADQAYQGAISEKMPRLPGVVDTLKEAFGDDLADFTGAHSSRRQQDLEDFNRGGKKHLVATYGAGGVGVSLHDLSGEAPRAVVYLGPPWSGVMFDQAIGRPWRFGTKSNVNAYFLTSNAQPEMKLIFQKVLPRFESLKASVSGIKKADPIVGAMKDLDAYLAYEFGNDTAVGFDQFMNTVQTSAVSSYKEVPITSADGAKNKGMRVERREMDKPPGPPKLYQAENISQPPADLPEPGDRLTERDEKSASLIRRPFVSESTEKEITDPRVLDKINDQNMAALGIDSGEKPPSSPGEAIGNRMIPRPGEAEVKRKDLAYPKLMGWVREWAEQHFSEQGVPLWAIDRFAEAERAFRLGLAEKRDSSHVLEAFPETAKITQATKQAEREWSRDVASTTYDYMGILKKHGILDDNIAERKVDQALRMTDQSGSTMSLLGEPSKWLDGSVFTENELKAAQEIRNKIYDSVYEKAKEKRPNIGFIRKYSGVIQTGLQAALADLYPELNGHIPADLEPFFSLEIRRGMTKEPFSSHALKRRGEPPKTFKITDVLESYVPSMLKIAHYTDAAHKVTKLLTEVPEDSTLKEYATKYARIVFGVPSEYKRMDRIHYKLSKMIRDVSYAGALELNPAWFTMHLTKVPVNTWPELGKDGMKFIWKGMERMRSEEGRELVARSGVLMDKLWSSQSFSRELKRHPKNWLRLTTSASDVIDRSVSYLGALEKAKDLGFLGPKEAVGDITWKRLNELAANGVDVNKAISYAESVIARSEFFYTDAHVQMWQREHPILGMYSHYLFREGDFVSSIKRIAKEVKAQPDPDAYIQQKVSEGHYEYIDAVAKYRRLLMSIAGSAAIAVGLGGPIFGRFFPFHLRQLLAYPVIFANDTVKLMIKTIEGDAKEKDWERWIKGVFKMTPYVGGAMRTLEMEETPKKKHRRSEGFEKFEFEPLPQ